MPEKPTAPAPTHGGDDRAGFMAAATRLLEVARALVERARRRERAGTPPGRASRTRPEPRSKPTGTPRNLEKRRRRPTARSVSSRRARPAGATTPDLSSIAEHTIAATVQVEHGDIFGTGFVVHPSGLVITARHVVEVRERSLRRVQVRLADGTETTATIVRSHPILDFALMWLDPPGPFAAVTLGRAGSLRPAETVLAVGHPFQFRNTVSRGIVSNPAAESDRLVFVQTDAAVDPGNSGGPLVDSRGLVVGINLWIVRGAGSAKFALPIDYLIEDVERVLTLGRGPSLERPYCRWCGSLHDTAGWYCPTCGAQEFERDPSPENGDSMEDKVRRRLRSDENDDAAGS